MRSWLTLTLALTGVSYLPSVKPGIGSIDLGDDSLFTLVLLQMVTNGEDPTAMRSLYPLLLTSIMGDDDDDEGGLSNAMYYLLLGAGNDENMQSWLPLILNNDKKSTSDKLLMMIFMQRSMVTTGTTGMSSMFPLLLLNANDNKYCGSGASKCTCEEDNSEMLLYIMLLNSDGYGVSGDRSYNNFMFMLFDDDKCDGETPSGDSCSCDDGDDIEGGIDAVTWMMLMQMHPSVETAIEKPPQRAIDIGDMLKQQLFASLGPEYTWMSQFTDTDSKSLMKFQIASQMGIPVDVLTLLENGGAQSSDERFALIQWMSRGSSLSIETMSLMLGIEDAKQFYVHSMIENGQVDAMTASLLLASQGSTSKEKMKELLIMAATGQIQPETFATIAKPYVPALPEGTYPGQELYFIHLEMLDLNTCALVEPSQRKECSAHFGSFVTAEQCEVHPYCCYNPYTLDENVPWCYYNIFFVFHDQYKLRIKEADQFKGPQDCPGLFRYGLNLDPFMYYQAVNELDMAETTFGSYSVDAPAAGAIAKLGKLIHYRRDVGFPGITEFHCKAIKGACWDANSATYPAQYKIPQCYEEYSLDDGSGYAYNLYDPELFKPIVPAQFRAAIGECDTNYFHISTLYYERRACTYTIDMIKYGSAFSPLSEPTREDCLFRLGCCWEEDEGTLAKYDFMPRCYQRVKDTLVDDRLYDMTPLENAGDRVCGAGIDTFIDTVIITDALNIKNHNAHEGLDNHKSRQVVLAEARAGDNNVCLYHKLHSTRSPNSCIDDDAANENCEFWSVFDVFNREELVENYYKFDGVPDALRGMVPDLF